MKRSLLILGLLASLAFAEEVKVYGLITYVSQDNSLLHLGDMVVMLSGSDIEGVLTVGSLVEVEGYWQNQTFYAEEVEVEHLQANVVIYRGLVQHQTILGVGVPELKDGVWLEVIAEYKPDSLNILLVKPLIEHQSSIQAKVESLTPDGFIAAGVRVVSPKVVRVGQQVNIVGDWNSEALTEYLLE